jgi:choline-glycine betaine transporter
VFGVVAAPTGFGFLWFAVVGGTGIELERTGKADVEAATAHLRGAGLMQPLGDR